MKLKWEKIKRWFTVLTCKHDWVETYYFRPDYKYRFICTKCGEEI